MDRRAFIAIASGSILAAPLAAGAQQAEKVYRVGFLARDSISSQGASGPIGSLLEGLRDLGYAEGRNLVIESRAAGAAPGRYRQLIGDFEQLKVDVVVAVGTPAAVAAKDGTSTIPIVMLFVSDPVGMGLVRSLARPGGNLTGVSMAAPETYSKSLELLKEVSPRVSHVAALINPANPAHVYLRRDNPIIGDAVQKLGLRLTRLGVGNSNDLDGVFRDIQRQGFDALTVSVLQLGVPPVRKIAEFAVQRRLPSVALQRDYVEAGLMMSYVPSFNDHARRGAYFIDKILRGTKPADLPVEQPTKFELTINLKTAKALGLTIPQTLLLRADQVIE